MTAKILFVIFFFFKQKTAYEIQGDWSSDVCSSDLGDGREEAQEIPQARVQRPSSARVALVRTGFHHLDVVRRKQVPEEVPSPVRREEQVQVLVGPAARFDEPVQLREDPFVGGLELSRLGLFE